METEIKRVGRHKWNLERSNEIDNHWKLSDERTAAPGSVLLELSPEAFKLVQSMFQALARGQAVLLQATDEPTLLSFEEAAALLGFSLQKLSELVAEHKLTLISGGASGKPCFLRQDLIAFRTKYYQNQLDALSKMIAEDRPEPGEE